MRIRTVPRLVCVFSLGALLLVPSTAAADITAFLGINPTPSNRVVRGLAVGAGLLVVGFEFEYAATAEDLNEAAPALATVMVNGLVQTPIPIAGMQFYGTAGVGGYRETLDDVSETNFGMNLGGGVKMSLVGPLRLRLDYRVFTLRGEPRHSKPQRFYAGLNLKF
jgi:opacity protein-like surface antigen